MSGGIPVAPFMAWTGTALPLPFSPSFVFRNEYSNVHEIFS
jgi:hypothetical protein